jgi:hypothetical protein
VEKARVANSTAKPPLCQFIVSNGNASLRGLYTNGGLGREKNSGLQ